MPDPVPDPAPPPPQPFWTSKSFWTAALGLVFFVLAMFHVIQPTVDTVTLSGLILAVLSGVFRWTADQPLTTKSIGSVSSDGQIVQNIK